MKKHLWAMLLTPVLCMAVMLSACRKESGEELLADDGDLFEISTASFESPEEETSGTTGSTGTGEDSGISGIGEDSGSSGIMEDPERSLDHDPGISPEARTQYRVLAQDSEAVYYLSDFGKTGKQTWGVTEGKLELPRTSPAFIFRGDKVTGASAPICRKEGCSHRDQDCGAAFYTDGILGFSLYDGDFYWASLETGQDHEDGIGIYRMQKDGSGKVFLGAVPMYAFGFTEEMFTSEWMQQNSWEFPEVFFHRGYLYIVTKTEHYREDRFSGGVNTASLHLSVCAVSLSDFHDYRELFSETFPEHNFCTTELGFDGDEAALVVWEDFLNEETGLTDYAAFPPRLSVYRMGIGREAKLLYQASEPNAWPSLFARDGRTLLLMSVMDENMSSGTFSSETVLFEVDSELGSLRKLLTVGSKNAPNGAESIRFANGYLIGMELAHQAGTAGREASDYIRMHVYDLYGQELHSFAFDPDRVTMGGEPGVPYPNPCIFDAEAFYGCSSQAKSAWEKGYFYMVPLTGSDLILFEPEEGQKEE